MNDLRFAFRQLLKNPGFTAVAVLTLALGIGATTAITSVVRTVLLDPIPVSEPDRLVRLVARHRQAGWTALGLNPPALRELRQQTNLFSRLGFYEFDQLTLQGNDFPKPVDGLRVNPDFFRLWQVAPVVGRVFAEAEAQPGSDQVVVLNHRFWQREFGGDPAIVGRNVSFKEGVYTVVGVMPPHFHYLPGADYWRPFAGPKIPAPAPGQPLGSQGEYFHNTGIIAELRPGVEAGQVGALLRVMHERQMEAWPELKDFELQVKPLTEMFVSPEVRRTFWALLGGIVVVLVIACANVANLQLARVETRQQELAVRVALGAGRGRLFRQLLVESVLLSVFGGLAGLLLTAWGLQALEQLVPALLPRAKPVTLDGGVFALALLVSLATGVLFGLAPAWQAGRARVNETLKLGAATTTRGSRAGAWFSRGLIVAQVALTLVLLVGAGLMVRSVRKLLHTEMGFNTRGVALVYPSYDLNAFLRENDPVVAVDAFFSDLRQRVAALPGVQAAGVALEGGGISVLPNHSSAQAVALEQYFTGAGDEDALRALGVPLKQGRWLESGDRTPGSRSVLLNEAAARRLFPEGKAVGRRLWPAGASNAAPYEVVGVVGNVNDQRFDPVPRPILYRAINGTAVIGPARFLVVRTVGRPALLERAIGREMKAGGADQAPPLFMDLEQQIDLALAPNQTFMTYLLAFAATGLVLAALGLYGVLSFSVARRTREIGIRMALGSARHEIVKLVVGQGMRLAASGVVAGVMLALASTRLLKAFLFGIQPGDPLTFASVGGLLLLVATLACWLPARRAARVDPMVALRSE